MSKCAFASVLVVFLATAAVADQPPQQNATTPATTQAVPDGGMPTWIRPETPEQRMARIGTPEDPGLDPDPNKHFWRFGRSYHIEKYERRLARYDREPGTVRPLAMVNFAYELYQHNEKWVWIWVEDLPDAAPTAEHPAPARAPTTMFTANHIAFFKRIRPQYTELTPPDANVTVRFKESSNGLPTKGSWRNSVAVADINGDGFVDLVAPPERGGSSTTLPAIFLGNGKGEWKFWESVVWPRSLDYGGVAAGDFNKDGKVDLAFAIHLRNVAVFLNQGGGKFVESSAGLPETYATRRVIVTDVDRDGFPDIVASSEGPTVLGSSNARAKILAFLNRKKGRLWEVADVADPTLSLGGDWLSSGDLNGDSYPDFVGSSVYYGSTSILQLSAGRRKWKSAESDGDVIPSMSTYSASAVAPFTSKKKPAAVISYVRNWPNGLDAQIVAPPQFDKTVNVDLLTVGADGAVKRQSIVRWGGGEAVYGLANGDFNGDGNQDIMYVRYNPRQVEVVLGDGNGGFTRAVVEGLPVQPNPTYDIKVADVNKDGRPDVIMMYESTGTTALADRDGAIRVFLNQGPVTAGAAAK